MSTNLNANQVPTNERMAPAVFNKHQALRALPIVLAFAAGSGATAAVLQHRPPTLVMLAPSAISSMHDESPVAVRGQVVEIFGNKFVVQDDSGRALVETGRKGESGALVTKSETVVVQGRFDRGFIHAEFISHGDGRNEFVGPPGPPPRSAPSPIIPETPTR